MSEHLIKNNGVHIYFGTASDSHPAKPAEAYGGLTDQELIHQTSFKELVAVSGLQKISFLKQVHGVNGNLLRRSEEIPPPFFLSGDFLVTTMRQVGLGIMTADCLPLICYSRHTPVIGIAHVGWKGALAGIIFKLLDMMQQVVSIETVEILFGPAAKSCCYQVNQTWYDLLSAEQQLFVSRSMITRQNELFFDLTRYCYNQLLMRGITETAIDLSYNECTICTLSYCSYRRDSHQAGRQATVVWLAH